MRSGESLTRPDNEGLDQWFEKQEYLARDFECNLIYLNRENNLENPQHSDPTWGRFA